MEIGEYSIADLSPDDIRTELKRLYLQLEVLKAKDICKDNPHISKRKGGRKTQHRRFSLQKKGSKDNKVSEYSLSSIFCSLCHSSATRTTKEIRTRKSQKRNRHGHPKSRFVATKDPAPSTRIYHLSIKLFPLKRVNKCFRQFFLIPPCQKMQKSVFC